MRMGRYYRYECVSVKSQSTSPHGARRFELVRIGTHYYSQQAEMEQERLAEPECGVSPVSGVNVVVIYIPCRYNGR